MKKWILRISLGFIALLIILLVVGLLVIDPIIRSKVESTTQTSVGETTHLSGANLKIMDNTLTLSGLSIANPQGYSSPEFLSMKDCIITVQPKSLLTNTVQVDTIVIDGLHLSMQQSALKNNLNDILASIQKQRAANDAGASDAQSKQLAIHKITLTNTQVTLRMDGLPGAPPAEMSATLDKIEIDEPMNPDGRLMKVADLSARILLQIAQQAATNPKFAGAFGSVLQASLKNVDQGLKSMQGTVQNVGKQVQQGVNDLTHMFDNKKK